MKAFRPLFLIVAFTLLVGMACAAVSGDNTRVPDEEPTEQDQPTEEEQPTAEEEATDVPDDQSSSNDLYFTEEFDQDPGSDWETFVLGDGADDHEDDIKTDVDDSHMRFELPNDDLYLYYIYNGNSYDDVQLEMRADNRGVNTNNVSLVCRFNDDGWYEWSVGSGGDWYLYAVADDEYNLITNGGTLFLKQGKEVNEYKMACDGNTISAFVNGKEIKGSPFTDKKYNLRAGSVGFNISSLDVTPVIVEVDWFKVSEP
jgi:hypothetical protein